MSTFQLNHNSSPDYTPHRGGRYQAVGVIAHVPERNQRQGHPGTVLGGNLVLPRHNGGNCPPATTRERRVTRGHAEPSR